MQIQDFVYDDVLFKYCCYENVIKVVQDIIGADVVAVHTMLLNKPPDANPEMSLHPLHQVKIFFVLKGPVLLEFLLNELLINLSNS